MKKLISLALALMLVLSLSTVAFAEEVSYKPSDATTFTINKTYTSDEDWVPGEILEFEIAAVDGNPDNPMISIGTDNTYKVTGTSNTITVNVPSYDVAGIYKYTIKEKAGTTAGVTSYDTGKTINVSVLVEYDNTNHKLVIGNDQSEAGVVYFITKDSDNQKTDTFENVFQTRDFTVEKDVIGNMANETETFEITVTLSTDKTVLTDIQVGGETVPSSKWENGTYTKELTISESSGPIAFNNIPYGVTVTVEETNAGSYTLKGYADSKSENNTYTNLPQKVSFETNYEKTFDKDVVVVNEKTVSVDTGINMDSMPYVLLLAVAAVGLVVMFTKKRMMREF